MNPFDASALEYALRIPNAEVSVLTMSPPSCKEALTQLTRLPIKEIVMLWLSISKIICPILSSAADSR